MDATTFYLERGRERGIKKDFDARMGGRGYCAVNQVRTDTFSVPGRLGSEVARVHPSDNATVSQTARLLVGDFFSPRPWLQENDVGEKREKARNRVWSRPGRAPRKFGGRAHGVRREQSQFADTRSYATHGSKRIFTGEIADRPLPHRDSIENMPKLGTRGPAQSAGYHSSDLLRASHEHATTLHAQAREPLAHCCGDVVV